MTPTNPAWEPYLLNLPPPPWDLLCLHLYGQTTYPGDSTTGVLPSLPALPLGNSRLMPWMLWPSVTTSTMCSS